ncbi:TetR/AcrR family transcriptional regulator [Anaeromyxobacter dehalogenans]|uniref:Transcriptional regulator, TetR family n=1 Tax=Anaeromyxobacter dehalogenans (strain 2CP-C) TaxID=290397 RepID=Q2IDI3_ANADE|nr:TetR/AcrR family transcriptional regulator [Anaeromyxobacter dehalogenans]ABC82645.1 transcriptional regulator, TetR family [Anaeromyxobacter dehalogenans 2CP-C]
MRVKPARDERQEKADEPALRRRILEAAFTAFAELGYSRTSTREIATRAHVSKRDLYAHVGNKLQLLIECIRDRSARFPVAAELPDSTDREMLQAALTRFGQRFLTEVTDPDVVEVFRLAIAEANSAPEVARALEEFGREKARSALRGALTNARERAIVAGEPAAMTREFLALLWGDLAMNLLLRTVKTPNEREIAARSADAARALLALHPAPKRRRSRN